MYQYSRYSRYANDQDIPDWMDSEENEMHMRILLNFKNELLPFDIITDPENNVLH